MGDIRNRIIHHYFGIDYDIVWDTVKTDIPLLKEAIEIMAYSISRKLCHEPMVFLKRRAEEEDAADKFIDLTRRMFNLDDEFVPDDAHEDRKPGEMGDGQDEQSGPECI